MRACLWEDAACRVQTLWIHLEFPTSRTSSAPRERIKPVNQRESLIELISSEISAYNSDYLIMIYSKKLILYEQISTLPRWKKPREEIRDKKLSLFDRLGKKNIYLSAIWKSENVFTRILVMLMNSVFSFFLKDVTQ